MSEICTNQSTGARGYPAPATQADEAAASLHNLFNIVQIIQALLIVIHLKDFVFESNKVIFSAPNFFRTIALKTYLIYSTTNLLLLLLLKKIYTKIPWQFMIVYGNFK